jgi:hypothetical protein
MNKCNFCNFQKNSPKKTIAQWAKIRPIWSPWLQVNCFCAAGSIQEEMPTFRQIRKRRPIRVNRLGEFSPIWLLSTYFGQFFKYKLQKWSKLSGYLLPSKCNVLILTKKKGEATFFHKLIWSLWSPSAPTSRELDKSRRQERLSTDRLTPVLRVQRWSCKYLQRNNKYCLAHSEKNF